MALRTKCPVCASPSVVTFLTRHQTPVHQHLIIGEQQAARQVARSDLILGCCGRCGFVFNQAFDPARLRYGKHYDNAQTYSATFRAHVDSLIQHLLVEKEIRNSRIVEVGCGQGAFLRRLVEAVDADNTGYGFDPSFVGPEVDLDGRLVFKKQYYGPENASITADVVLCRHVIEHVAEPVDLLRTIRATLIHSPQARVFLETPCVEWILEHQAFWDFFYEHCSYFTAASLTTACAAAGFRVESVRHVFGGQYLWLEAVPDPTPTDLAVKPPGAIQHLAIRFAAAEADWRQQWQARLRSLASRQNVAVWGAGAKGVTFANLIDSECRWIACVVDLNPNKQGRYVPGTGHPIVGPHGLTEYGVGTVLVMNPNYDGEIRASLREANLEVILIHIGEL